jgi:hypothetical protein
MALTASGSHRALLDLRSVEICHCDLNSDHHSAIRKGPGSTALPELTWCGGQTSVLSPYPRLLDAGASSSEVDATMMGQAKVRRSCADWFYCDAIRERLLASGPTL